MDLILRSYPAFFLSILSYIFFKLLINWRRGGSHGLLITSWPVIRMLPALLTCLYLPLQDVISNTILRTTGYTFLVLGPVLSNMKIMLTSNPANVRHIFKSNFHNYPKGQHFSEVFDILGSYSILTTDGETWRSLRKTTHAILSQPQFRAFVARITRHKVDHSLLPLLRRISEQGRIVDLQDLFLRLTFDFTSNMAFGFDPATLGPILQTTPFAKAIDEATTTIMHRHLLPTAWWKLMRRLKLGQERKLAEAWRVIDDFIAERIAEKEANDGADHSILGSFVQYLAGIEDSGNYKLLRDMMFTLIVAGRDTVGVALAWFFYLVYKNPNVEAKLFEEITQSGGSTTEAEGESHLVYLHAALFEALRLYPPLPLDVKDVVADDTLPSGDRVEAGMKMVISIYAMGRMEGVWGEDCMEFRPERWITEEGRVRHEPSYKFMSFACGPRSCLGKDMAMMQLKVTAAAVLKEFRVVVVEGRRMDPKASVLLQMRNGLMVRLKKREYTN